MRVIYVFHVFTVYLNSLEVETAVLNFGVDDITVTLSWAEQESDMSYNVTVVPQVTMRLIPGSKRASVQLTIFYNTLYNVSIVATLCGHNIFSTAIGLSYGEFSHT